MSSISKIKSSGLVYPPVFTFYCIVPRSIGLTTYSSYGGDQNGPAASDFPITKRMYCSADFKSSDLSGVFLTSASRSKNFCA